MVLGEKHGTNYLPCTLNVGFSLYFIYYKINFFTYPLIDFVNYQPQNEC